MSLSEVLMEGTLKTDGTIELDRKPDLEPGRVSVILRPVCEQRPAEDWWQYLQRTRQELEQQNYPTMTEQEVESHVNWLRGDDDRIEDVYRQIEEERRRGQTR